MIYILSSRDEAAEKFYGIERVIDSFHTLGIEDLLAIDAKHRLALLNPPDNLVHGLLSLHYPLVQIHPHERLHHGYVPLPLPRDFFQRDAREVVRELLGKLVMRRVGDILLLGKILETEAYYGPEDPASRAYRGKKNYNRGMWLPGGHIFVYMVHANWMFNITTDGDEPQAVLIRAVEPLAGLNYMYARRKRGLRELCNGPGKWTQAFGIERAVNERPIGEDIAILDSPWRDFEVKCSHRIGVKRDMEEPLRFFIPSKFTSNNRIF